MRHLIMKFCVAAAVLCVTSAAMAEQIDNSQYKEWAKYKPGTTITMKQTTALPQMAMPAGMPPGMDMSSMMPSTMITTKLTEVKPDSLTLEIVNSTSQAGRSNDTTLSRVVPAKVENPATQPANVAATQAAQIKDMKEGKEVVDVNGKKINTITREFTTTGTVDTGAAAGVPARGRADRAGRAGTADTGTPVESHVKTWTSTEVPGGSVKTETTTNVEGMGEMKIIITLTDFNIVK